ncbi:GerAB/ArcD/ProY family transporter [Paenibacillus sp. NPDC056722]|uniref:GerAB/ArcD/ProY family transporter n=1 Tax=Paenibacillus sp. NPDC056722 TaxID=3345924 RepID=UPI0036A6E428
MTKPMVVMLFIQLHLTAMLSIFTVRILEVTSLAHWEAILLDCVLEMLLVWIYLKGLSRFPGKNMIEIISETTGTWLARLILLPFAVFLFFHLTLLNRYQIFKINVVLLQDTPLWAITLIYMALPLYAACKGFSVILRISAALFIFYIPFVLFSLFISAHNFDFHNIFPIWDPKMTFLAQPTYYSSLISFSGFLFLGMLSLDKPFKPSRLMLVMIILAFFYLSTVYVPLLIFSEEVAITFQYPNVLASDTIDLEWVVFDWLPTFSVVSSTGLGILEAATTLWTATTLIKKLFLPINEVWIASGLTLAMFLLSMLVRNSSDLNHFLLMNSIPGIYSMLVLPLAVALSGLWKRRASA